LATVGTTNNPTESSDNTTPEKPHHRRSTFSLRAAIFTVPVLVAGLLSATAIAPADTASAASARTSYTFTSEKVVKVAKRYAGSRYRFGGASPRGFDCSGFTKYVYSKFGISLPHSALAQGRVGKRVSKKNAKPGDLVITSGGSHVGIYVGKSRFIDAPMPGRTVHVRKIYTSNYYIVRVKTYKKQSA
jgi:cell wall-associated NlpC family hydrolase